MREQESADLRFAEDERQLPLLARPLNELHPIRIAQYDLVVIAHGVHHLVQVAFAHLAFGGHVVLVGLNVLGSDVRRVFLRKVQEEVLGGVEVGPEGAGTVIPIGHTEHSDLLVLFPQSFSEWTVP